MKPILDFIKKYLPTSINFIKKYLILLLLAVIIILFFMWKTERNNSSNLKQEVLIQKNLTTAVLDTITRYKNEKNEWVASKLTMQDNLKDLMQNYNLLNSNQKDLLDRVKALDKKNDLIAAALIKTIIKVDSLNNFVGKIDTVNHNIAFNDSTVDLKFNLNVLNVKPFSSNLKPLLDIKDISLNNTQFVTFSWDNDKKLGYPVSFSISNSNKFAKTLDIQSFSIPLNKENIAPTGWERFWSATKKNSTKIGWCAVGIGGAVIVLKVLGKI